MYRSELAERIGARLKRAGVPAMARTGITNLVMTEFKDILNEQIDAVVECALIVLHDEYGFGQKRCADVVKKMNDLVGETYDNYGLESLIKFQLMLHDREIEYHTILDDRKEKQNGNKKD